MSLPAVRTWSARPRSRAPSPQKRTKRRWRWGRHSLAQPPHFSLSLSPPSIPGYAESAVVGFVLALARKASSPSALAHQLEGQGLPAGAATAAFAAALLGRLPGASGAGRGGEGAAAAAAARDRAAAALAARNERYSLVLEDEEDELPPAPAPAPAPPDAAKAAKKAKKKQLRRGGSGGADDDEPAEAALPSSRKRPWEERDAAANAATATEDAARAAAEADEAERAAFEARLAAKDEAKTRKLEAGAALPPGEVAAAAARAAAAAADQPDARAAAIADLRASSRVDYLRRREAAKLAALEAEVAEEEALFAGQALSAKEKADLAYKKKVLALARERVAVAAEAASGPAYHMPTAYDGDGGVDQAARYGVLDSARKGGEEGAPPPRPPLPGQSRPNGRRAAPRPPPWPSAPGTGWRRVRLTTWSWTTRSSSWWTLPWRGTWTWTRTRLWSRRSARRRPRRPRRPPWRASGRPWPPRARPCPSTPLGTTCWPPWPPTRPSSSWARRGLGKRPKSRSTCTRRDTPRAASPSAAPSPAGWRPCPSRPGWRRRWAATWAGGRLLHPVRGLHIAATRASST